MFLIRDQYKKLSDVYIKKKEALEKRLNEQENRLMQS